MLNLLDDALASFLRAAVPLPADVAIAFEAPDREWGSRVTGPTVNLYLWDVRENLSAREIGLATTTGPDGVTRRHGPMPRLDCRYLVTAWTTEASDEHALLGRVVTALLLHPVLEARHLKGPLAVVEPPPVLTLGARSADAADFWSALGGQLKPGLDLVVTLTVDAVTTSQAGPPVADVVVDERRL